MAAVIATLRRRTPIVWLIASTGFGLGALVLMLAGSAWPLPVLMAVAQAALLAIGAVGYLSSGSAQAGAQDQTRR
jgi:hypothetical protein